jgi:hypothetical protein
MNVFSLNLPVQSLFIFPHFTGDRTQGIMLASQALFPLHQGPSYFFLNIFRKGFTFCPGWPELRSSCFMLYLDLRL